MAAAPPEPRGPREPARAPPEARASPTAVPFRQPGIRPGVVRPLTHVRTFGTLDAHLAQPCVCERERLASSQGAFGWNEQRRHAALRMDRAHRTTTKTSSKGLPESEVTARIVPRCSPCMPPVCAANTLPTLTDSRREIRLRALGPFQASRNREVVLALDCRPGSVRLTRRPCGPRRTPRPAFRSCDTDRTLFPD